MFEKKPPHIKRNYNFTPLSLLTHQKQERMKLFNKRETINCFTPLSLLTQQKKTRAKLFKWKLLQIFHDKLCNKHYCFFAVIDNLGTVNTVISNAFDTSITVRRHI